MQEKYYVDEKDVPSEVYDEVLQVLDSLSFGFPKSYIRSDKALIKCIFSKLDAADYVLMSEDWMTAADYAAKNDMPLELASEKLARLASKGLIFRRHGEQESYRQFPFVMGLLEWQVNNTNRKWLLHTSLYMISSHFGKRMSQQMPFYRTVPIHKEFVEGSVVAPYDDIDAILDRHTRFAVATCICRLMYKMKPFNPCKHPMETCIETDDYATYFIENGIGREITKDEAREIIRGGEKDGRIINVTNSKDGENICSCCACGCGMLYLKTKYPGPSGDFWSNHYSVIDQDKCVGCGVCVQRCPFKYITKGKNGKPVVDAKACLGCGLCVSTCPQKAIVLHKKAEDKVYEPPETYEDAMRIWKQNTKKDYKNFK